MQAVDSKIGDQAIYGMLYLGCATVTSCLATIFFSYFSLFSVYLLSTLMFSAAWWMNKSEKYLEKAKFVALAGMLISSAITIISTGSVHHPVTAWLLVTILSVAILNNRTVLTTAVLLVTLIFVTLSLASDLPWLQNMRIDAFDEDWAVYLHQLMQLVFIAIALLVNQYITSNYQDKLLKTISTANDLNAELERAKQEAQQANNIKTMFLSNMSHEIRTPLNGLNGMLHLLLDHEDLDDKARHYVQIALDSNDRLLEQANNILNIARIEAQQLDLYPSDVNLMTLFGPLKNKYLAKALSKDLHFNWDIHLDSVWVYADGERLSEILSHLCDNAIKYTHAGRVSVHISEIQHQGSMFELNIIVADTGIGFDKDKLDYFLSPFTQADMTYTREYEGAGLGLALVNKLLILMGGTLDIETDLNRGTQLQLKIPLKPSLQYHGDDSKTVVNFHEGPHLKATEFDEDKGQVLLVEDDPNNVKLLQVLLRDYDINVHIASNGKEALDCLSRIPRCDLMFIDMYMPIMNGLDTMQLIRQDPRWESLQTIVVTSSTDDALLDRWRELGVEDILNKPIATSDFDIYVDRFLGDYHESKA